MAGEVIYERTERLVGPEVMQRLQSARVILFGIGGVGSWCAEALVRSGVTNLAIVDADRIGATNVNRQLMATSANIGASKVAEMKARLLSVNPAADIRAIEDVYTDETRERFALETYDYIIDAIDSLKDKASLILRATDTRATFFSSMGAALKLDPTQVRVAEFWEVRGCPLGAALRKDTANRTPCQPRSSSASMTPRCSPTSDRTRIPKPIRASSTRHRSTGRRRRSPAYSA